MGARLQVPLGSGGGGPGEGHCLIQQMRQMTTSRAQRWTKPTAPALRAHALLLPGLLPDSSQVLMLNSCLLRPSEMSPSQEAHPLQSMGTVFPFSGPQGAPVSVSHMRASLSLRTSSPILQLNSELLEDRDSFLPSLGLKYTGVP